MRIPMLAKKPKGVVALVTIIIIGALILAIGLSASFVGQTEVILSGQLDREYLARTLAQTCVDEGMHRLKLNSSYTGGTIPIGTDTCTITITGSGSSRTVTASATSDVFTKTAVVTASLVQNAAASASAWHVDAWGEGDPP